MKKWQDQLENLSAEDTLWLTAVFLSTLLGTVVSSVILRWGLSSYSTEGIMAQLAVCMLATAAYAGVAVLVFYLILPEARLTFKRIFNNKK